MNIHYFTTGRKKGKEVYYPPLVRAQIYSLAPYINSSEIHVVTSFLLPFYLLKCFTNNLKKKGGDIIHAQYGSFTALVAWLNSRNKPLIISLCGSDLEGTAGNGFLWTLRDFITTNLSKWLSMRADQVIVKSENLKQHLPAKARKRVQVIPNGVDINKFYPVDKKDARKMLDWDVETKYVLFTPSKANNQLVKNLPLALRSVELVREKTEYSVELIMLTNKTREEVALMMNAADCLLLTSFHEGSPNVVKEAMACNLPVISVNVGDVLMRLKDDHLSSVVDSYEPKEIAQFILRTLKLNSRTRGFEEIKKQQLDSISVANNIYKIYQDLLNV